MDKASFSDLFKRYLNDDLTSHELISLRDAARKLENQTYLNELIENAVETELPYQSPVNADLQHIRHYLMTEVVRPVKQPAHGVFQLHKWRWAAAFIILAISAAIVGFLISRSPDKKSTTLATAPATDIAPGKQGAVLTLADGRQMVLDSLGDGTLIVQNGATLVLRDGQLSYDGTGNATGEMMYNTMSTPRGRVFQLTLPDGTKVWLNAASSIRYPTAFAGKERRVNISGEVYFEVAKNTRQPFRVNVGNLAEVNVLGTNFNVSAYEEESVINTTLLEGSVSVSAGQNTEHNKIVVLKPGQAAKLMLSDKHTKPEIILTPDANIEKVMAWKNGLFNFEGKRLREVMQQLERWYDIEVVYEKNVPNIEFYGKINRNISLSGMMKALELSDVHFRIQGRKLIILP